MNTVNLVGRLVRDPETRKAGEGIAVGMTIAVDRGLSKAKKEEFQAAGKPTADFIRLTAFGKLAEVCSKHLGKGRLISVTGKIQTGSYQTEDGSRKYTTDVVVNQLDILDWPNSDGEKQPTEIDGFTAQESDDDIPF